MEGTTPTSVGVVPLLDELEGTTLEFALEDEEIGAVALEEEFENVCGIVRETDDSLVATDEVVDETVLEDAGTEELEDEVGSEELDEVEGGGGGEGEEREGVGVGGGLEDVIGTDEAVGI